MVLKPRFPGKLKSIINLSRFHWHFTVTNVSLIAKFLKSYSFNPLLIYFPFKRYTSLDFTIRLFKTLPDFQSILQVSLDIRD